MASDSLVSLILYGPTPALRAALDTVSPATAWLDFKQLMSLPMQRDFHQADTAERLPVAYDGLKARLAPSVDLGEALDKALEWGNLTYARRLLPEVSFTSEAAARHLRAVFQSKLTGMDQVVARASEAALIEAVQTATGVEILQMMDTLVAMAGALSPPVAEAWIRNLAWEPILPGSARFAEAWDGVVRSRARANGLAQQPPAPTRSRFRT